MAGVIEKEKPGRVLEASLVSLMVLVTKLYYFSDSVLSSTIHFEVADHSD